MLEMAEVEADARPFMLTMDEFDRLCNAYMDICDKNPGLIDYYFRSEESALYWRQDKAPLGIWKLKKKIDITHINQVCQTIYYSLCFLVILKTMMPPKY